MKKNNRTLIGVLALIILIGIAAFGIQQTTLSDKGYVQAPMFGFIKCDPSGTVKSSSVFSMIGEKQVGCSEVGPTTNCQLVVKTPDYSWWSDFERRVTVTDQLGNKIFQKKFNSMFGSSSSQTNAIIETLIPGDYLNPIYYNIKVEYQNLLLQWKIDNKAIQYFYNYQPYVIKKYDSFSSSNGQAITNIGKTSCEISSQISSDIIISSSIDLGAKEGNPDRLEPNEAYTYFTRHVTVPSFSRGTDVAGAYCVSTASGGSLYQIEEVTTESGTYQIVSPSYSDFIRNVDCCNGDSTPTKVCRNNMWVSTANAECSATKPCTSDQWQRDASDASGKRAIKYACVNSKCVAQIKQVACTLDSQCNAGEICSGFECKETCVGCNINNACGNGKCESWESIDTCKSDCSVNDSDTCSLWWQVPGTKVTISRSWYNYFGLGKPTVVETPTCNVAGWLVYLIVAGSIVIVLVSALIIFRPEIKKGSKKKK